MADNTQIEFRIIALLKKQLTGGTLDPEEQVILKQWLAKDTANLTLYTELQNEDLRDQWLEELEAFDSRAALQRVQAKVQKSATKRAYSPRRRAFSLQLAIAASFIFFLFVLAVYQWWVKPPAMHTVEVAHGDHREVKLPDGSRVFLNAGSVFSYPESFAGGERNVSLENGEAYFRVTADKAHPFIIETGNMDVKVLGTSFNIKTYLEDETSKVEVSSGKVAVIGANYQPVILLPGQRVIRNKASGKMTRSEVNSEDIAAWWQNRIIFDNEILKEVLKVLERHYDVKIQVKRPQLLQQQVTLKLDNQSLEAILDALSFTLKFKYEINDGKNITIK